MSSYEYTVIPAPARGEKARGARSGIERFAATLADVLNEMARDGWDYVRAETLPAEERSGLTSRTTVYHNLLIFRRALAGSADQPVAVAQPQPAAAAPQPEPEPAARGPFSQPMRAAPKPAAPAAPTAAARVAEPPLTAPPAPAPAGPRLGPASR
ncbi:DUF4177 domain-containing protein [Paracoccus sp. P2]|uniref:DUF4177 domain-containing protein n=1 Tax=Paracoccus pantotrophus TaxID=82367 RepID=A0A1I5CGG9_PARPN|nr:DUF4177 domain-containing protein [Paracoccus pantotrophus]MDF3852955.1 DUF4177 domain-containing protein [Paracoccus pantotrophus]QFG35683.1 DUF4177 domain-containing protein [Paracoccus pantotrophus]QLH13956.1 DUF4177 domain-containing protein [Paracoccus pantotrophus]RDE00959.1 DUF4177 domain-containing protein [Paracoccus pantotrophus]RKS44072.1 hypothetical protein BDE18_2902 [Paracoccus pantotrophus]